MVLWCGVYYMVYYYRMMLNQKFIYYINHMGMVMEYDRTKWISDTDIETLCRCVQTIQR